MPTLFETGQAISATGGHPEPMLGEILPKVISGLLTRQSSIALSPSDPDLDLVAELAEEAPHHIKIFIDGAIPDGSPKFDPQSFTSVVQRAVDSGKPVYVHAADPADAVLALEAGASVLMHTPYHAPLRDDDLARIVESQIPVVTTAQIWEWAQRGQTKEPPLTGLEKRLMSPSTEAVLSEDWHGHIEAFASDTFPPEFISEDIVRYHGNLVANLQRIYAAGGRILVGTDYGLPGLTPGASFIRELKYLESLGLSRLDVLRNATSVPGCSGWRSRCPQGRCCGGHDLAVG